ncbi:unnamed protein product [Cylindrotheca closterium]|uniref:Uncharacterized protein n=1 Tax=Cylindrotheca closterium TaxID=2856 RepID=A0AAD2FZQ0_9STRA|nr:unnamed protein product [Cylindrotheca closterium]
MPDAKEGEDRVYMKITGMMVQILIDMAPEYRKYVVLENGKRVIYVRVLRAIYGMLQSSLLFYNQFRSDLEQTIRFHVDNLMSSHMDPKVNEEFAVEHEIWFDQGMHNCQRKDTQISWNDFGFLGERKTQDLHGRLCQEHVGRFSYQVQQGFKAGNTSW